MKTRWPDAKTKLDAVIERLRALPMDEQDALADEIEIMLSGNADPLTPKQWATLDQRMAGDTRKAEPHEAVMAELKQRIGG